MMLRLVWCLGLVVAVVHGFTGTRLVARGPKYQRRINQQNDWKRKAIDSARLLEVFSTPGGILDGVSLPQPIYQSKDSASYQQRSLRKRLLSMALALSSLLRFASSCSASAWQESKQLSPEFPLSTWMQLRLVMRLLVAASAGGIVGWERASAKHSAGVRTMALVSLGASAFTICSAYGFIGKCDASRMASNVASGVGFIGAGVITTSTSSKKTNIVHGLTTAAAIWLSAAVGVASGTGLHIVAFSVALITVGILRLDRVTKSSNKQLESESSRKNLVGGDSSTITTEPQHPTHVRAQHGLDNPGNSTEAVENEGVMQSVIMDPKAFMDEVVEKVQRKQPLISLNVEDQTGGSGEDDSAQLQP